MSQNVDSVKPPPARSSFEDVKGRFSKMECIHTGVFNYVYTATREGKTFIVKHMITDMTLPPCLSESRADMRDGVKVL